MDNDYILDEIVVNRNGGLPVKKYKFGYKYLERGDLKDLSSFNPASQNNLENIRLILESLEEAGYNENSDNFVNIKQPYKFEYIRDKGLPSRFSNSQDSWGYYNGKSNRTLVPGIFLGTQFLDGANRVPELQYARQGLLSKIIFPTGGYTTYNYGLNECVNFQFNYYSPELLDQVSHKIGRYDLTKTEELFELAQGREVEIEFATATFSSFCSNNPCEVKLQLYSLKDDGSLDAKLFDSSEYASGTNADNNLEIKETIFLRSGKYKLIHTINDMVWASSQDTYYLDVKWYEISETEIYSRSTASGLRVEKIVTFDPYSGEKLVKRIKYEKGYLSNNFKHEESQTILKDDYCSRHETFNVFARSASSHAPLTFTNGGIVGYGKVTVYAGENGENGQVENYYYTINDHPDKLIKVQEVDISMGEFLHNMGGVETFNEDQWKYPFAPLDSKDWKRGLIKEVKVFDSNDIIKKITKYNYKFYDDPSMPYFDESRVDDIYGVKVGGDQARLCEVLFGDYPIEVLEGKLQINYYRLQSSWFELESKEEIVYDQNDPLKSFSTMTSYEYDNQHYQLLKSISINSNGKALITNNYYSTTLSGTSLGSNILRENHMHSQLLRQTQYVNDKRLSQSEVSYINSKGNVVPKSKVIFPSGNLEKITINYSFDEHGNIQEIQKEDGITENFVWSYNNALPVATISGATLEDIKSILPTGFLDLLGIQTDTDLIESYLSDMRAALDASLSVVDITTYTYKPGIGIVSETDPNGFTRYFEYDELGRLEIEKDHELNILKKNAYNYNVE